MRVRAATQPVAGKCIAGVAVSTVGLVFTKPQRPFIASPAGLVAAQAPLCVGPQLNVLIHPWCRSRFSGMGPLSTILSTISPVRPSIMRCLREMPSRLAVSISAGRHPLYGLHSTGLPVRSAMRYASMHAYAHGAVRLGCIVALPIMPRSVAEYHHPHLFRC